MSQNRRVANRFGKVFEYARERVERLNQLKPGDHIAYEDQYTYAYWHHMIVESITPETNKINVIHYYGEVGKALCYPRSTWAEVRRDSFHINKEKFYRIVYPENVECFPPSEVVRRANSRFGETKYHPMSNNCEHFATWCKTGTAKCLQVDTLKEIVVKGSCVGGYTSLSAYNWVTMKKLFLQVYEETINTARSYLIPALQKGGNYIAEKAWKVFEEICSTVGVPASWKLVEEMKSVVDDVLAQFTRLWKTGSRTMEAATTMGTAISRFGLAFVIAGGIETYLTYNDICEAYEKKEAGVISKVEYRNTVVKRVASGVCSVPMSIAGAVLGQAFIPIPVIGAIIGGIAGDIAGKVVGGLIGGLIGGVLNFFCSFFSV